MKARQTASSGATLPRSDVVSQSVCLCVLCVCVCVLARVCVCMREKERERERESLSHSGHVCLQQRRPHLLKFNQSCEQDYKRQATELDDQMRELILLSKGLFLLQATSVRAR